MGERLPIVRAKSMRLTLLQLDVAIVRKKQSIN